jgi:hypothetical protein
VKKNTFFLSALLIKIPGINNALVGDGYCQDLTNTAECNFDGGDCCGSCKITTIYPAVYIYIRTLSFYCLLSAMHNLFELVYGQFGQKKMPQTSQQRF